jgi:hypothetical protein
MKMMYRVAAVAAGAVVGVAALAGAAGAASHGPNGSKAAFFVGGNGTASWQSTGTSQVIQLSSPDGNSWGGFVGHGIDGVKINNIRALSYDFRVTTPNWNSVGGGSPRLVVELNDGWSLDLNPVTTLSTGTTWNHMDALTGSVDEYGPANQYEYQTPWSQAVTEHTGVTVKDAFVVNDSGWLNPLTVQISNLTLNNTVYNHPGNSNL